MTVTARACKLGYTLDKIADGSLKPNNSCFRRGLRGIVIFFPSPVSSPSLQDTNHLGTPPETHSSSLCIACPASPTFLGCAALPERFRRRQQVWIGPPRCRVMTTVVYHYSWVFAARHHQATAPCCGGRRSIKPAIMTVGNSWLRDHLVDDERRHELRRTCY